MRRFRVRRLSQDWSDPGPDLLRVAANAVSAVQSLQGVAADGWYTRVESPDGWWSWQGPFTKGKARARLDDWSPARTGQAFQFGRKEAGEIEPRIAVQFEQVRDLQLSSVNPRVEIVYSLVRHQFPNARFAGAFVCKQISGSSSWSDHAWGDGLDMTPEDNDRLTDWTSRMARSANAAYAYVLGSRDGRVMMSAAPDYDLEPSGASSSHLWHVHYSLVDHDGRNPGCR